MGGLNIKEIARIAGVSHTTVSRVMNDSPLISDKTKSLIREIAVKYGYTPNRFAKSLVLNRSFNIGLFFSSINSGVTSNYYFEIVTNIKQELNGKYNLITQGVDEFSDQFAAITLNTYDGIMLVSQNRSDDNFIKYLTNIKMPLVVVNRNISKFDVDCFFSDEREIVKNVINLFIKNGHKRIAFIRGADDAISTEERYSGYTDAITSAFGIIDKELVINGDYSIESGYKAGEKILKISERPTAVFSSNDFMAIGLYKAFNCNGIKIPEEISIAGFDATEISEYMTPALTTIKRPVGITVKEALKRLISRIEDKDFSNKPLIKSIKSTLIKRDSISKLKNI